MAYKVISAIKYGEGKELKTFAQGDEFNGSDEATQELLASGAIVESKNYDAALKEYHRKQFASEPNRVVENPDETAVTEPKESGAGSAPKQPRGASTSTEGEGDETEEASMQMTRAELVAMADEKGVTYEPSATKEELVEAINSSQEGGSQS